MCRRHAQPFGGSPFQVTPACFVAVLFSEASCNAYTRHWQGGANTMGRSTRERLIGTHRRKRRPDGIPGNLAAWSPRPIGTCGVGSFQQARKRLAGGPAADQGVRPTSDDFRRRGDAYVTAPSPSPRRAMARPQTAHSAPPHPGAPINRAPSDSSWSPPLRTISPSS